MGLTDGFGFYDLAGHLIPGAVVLTAAAWAGAAVDLWTMPAADNELAIGTFLVVFSYVVGHALHGVGGLDPVKRLHRTGPWRHEDHESIALTPTPVPDAKGAPLFHPTFLALLRQEIDRTLAPGLLHLPSGGESKGARIEAFRLCHTHVSQKGDTSRIQTFKAMAGFYRGTMVASAFVSLLGLLVALHAGLVREDGAATVLPLLLSAASALLAALSARQFRRFDERFVASVYRAFFTLVRSPAGISTASDSG